MSLKAGVDVAELLRRIDAELCPKCQVKVAAISVPITQSLTIAELLAQETRKK